MLNTGGRICRWNCIGIPEIVAVIVLRFKQGEAIHFSVQGRLKDVKEMANSVDSGQSDLVRRCLLMPVCPTI